jgi:hypothetical protein
MYLVGFDASLSVTAKCGPCARCIDRTGWDLGLIEEDETISQADAAITD